MFYWQVLCVVTCLRLENNVTIVVVVGIRYEEFPIKAAMVMF